MDVGQPTLLLKGIPTERTFGCSTAGLRLACQVIGSVQFGQERSLGETGPANRRIGSGKTLCSILAVPAHYPRRPVPPGWLDRLCLPRRLDQRFSVPNLQPQQREVIRQLGLLQEVVRYLVNNLLHGKPSITLGQFQHALGRRRFVRRSE